MLWFDSEEAEVKNCQVESNMTLDAHAKFDQAQLHWTVCHTG